MYIHEHDIDIYTLNSVTKCSIYYYTESNIDLITQLILNKLYDNINRT